MVKEKLLVDEITENRYLLPADHKPRTIGRDKNCDIHTYIPVPDDVEKLDDEKKKELQDNSALELRVSRLHAEITHESDGTVYVTHKSSGNHTYIGSPTYPFERQVYGREQMFPGEILTVATALVEGNKRVRYSFHLYDGSEAVNQEKIEQELRLDDTLTDTGINLGQTQ